ncbi:MAG: peroxidase [Calditrichaeota bacterium]|nr:MAG: peroxidase [Calditrichota bacterium]
MAFIDYISYEKASDKLKELYQRYGGKSKQPANIIRVSGVNPDVMKYHVDLYRAIMIQKSELTRHQREMIATVVSAINNCHY